MAPGPSLPSVNRASSSFIFGELEEKLPRLVLETAADPPSGTEQVLCELMLGELIHQVYTE